MCFTKSVGSIGGILDYIKQGVRVNIKSVAVIGAGTMGNGIAQVFAASGFDVIMCDISDERLNSGLTAIENSLNRLVKKELISEDKKSVALGRITTTTWTKDLAMVDLVIEAATENIEIKLKIFQELDEICQADAVLTSNTSSISLTKIAAATDRPDKVIGMHFMNPVPVMQLIEIIRALQTSDDTYEMIHQVSLDLGKTPVEVNDSPGFVSNRILVPMINEAIFALYEGIATPEAIDEVMKLGMNHPMGPLTLADLIGLDVCLSVMKVLHEEFRDSKFRPCPLLVKMVDAGYLGRKTAKGFYDYETS